MPKLFLELDDGTFYSLSRQGGAAPCWRFVQLVGKRQGAMYEVRLDGSCDCPDAQFRPRPEGCKHARALREAGLVGGPVLAAH